MIQYSVYLPDSGEILCTGTCEEDALPYVLPAWPEGAETVEEAANDLLHYIVDGEVVDRPSFDVPSTLDALADGETPTTLELPQGTRVMVHAPFDEELVIDESGELELTFDEPGEYTLHLSLFPYRDLEVVVHATAPESP